MEMRLKNIVTFLLLIICSIVIFSSCDNENWNEHYSINENVVSDNTLWETIQMTPNLVKFAQILKNAGYDKVLSESQMFTVWAPVDSALVDFNMDSTLLVKEFICNHITRFSYPATGAFETKISVLNTKVLIFKSIGSDFFFGDAKLIQKNLVSSNGILHLIDKRVSFFSNIWEYLEKDQRLDSVRNYLFSYNQIIFNEKNSIPGDVNAEGKTVYLDSVFYNANVLFKRLGYLSSEDSTYNVILPTNTAWTNSYNNIKTYFRYYANSASAKISADTLQRQYTMNALVKDLMFSNNMQPSPTDSLISTQKDVFYLPQYLFGGADKVVASNGNIYITNELKYNHWESWNKTITVEAEKLTGRDNTMSSVFNRNSNGSVITGISGNRYIEVMPTTSASNPTISFEIPNSLSGAAYNIYCVFVPVTAASANATDLKPCKVNFQLTYLNEAGTAFTQAYNNSSQSYITEKDKISKVLVVSNFKFPYCDFGLDKVNVKLKVISNVAQNQTTLYTRELLIDCIVLEPVH